MCKHVQACHGHACVHYFIHFWEYRARWLKNIGVNFWSVFLQTVKVKQVHLFKWVRNSTQKNKEKKNWAQTASRHFSKCVNIWIKKLVLKKKVLILLLKPHKYLLRSHDRLLLYFLHMVSTTVELIIPKYSYIFMEGCKEWCVWFGWSNSSQGQVKYYSCQYFWQSLYSGCCCLIEDSSEFDTLLNVSASLPLWKQW